MKFVTASLFSLAAALAPSCQAWTAPLTFSRTASSPTCLGMASRAAQKKETRAAWAAKRGFKAEEAVTDEEMSSATLEAILFDCDGVLADTERDGHRVAFNRAFEEKELEVVWEEGEYGDLLSTGGGKERMTAYFNQVGWPASLAGDEKAQEKNIADLHARKTDIFKSMITEGAIPIRPGVLRLVDEALANDIVCAVCSTSSEESVRLLVETLMGEERAAKLNIFAGDMVAEKKPAPDVYDMAVETLGLNKARTIVVEDTDIGLRAATAAGINCLITKSTYADTEEFSGANLVVDSLGEEGDEEVITLESLTNLL